MRKIVTGSVVGLMVIASAAVQGCDSQGSAATSSSPAESSPAMSVSTTTSALSSPARSTSISTSMATTTGMSASVAAPAASSDSSVPASSGAPRPPALPDSPAGRQVGWVLQQLAGGSGPDAGAAQQHFTAAFLKQLPAQQVAAVFRQLRALGPYQFSAFSGVANAGLASLRGPDDQRFLLSISTDPAGLISSLLIRPGPALPVVRSLADLHGALTKLGVNASVGLFRVSGTSAADCVPEQTFGDQGAHPLGSMFKLYVLGAVTTAVADHKLSWDQLLTVTDPVKSLPSGELQDKPAGTTVSVRDAAGLMIQISDNTAADLLATAVGRDAVEREIGAFGVEHPSLLTPFLRTREMFQLDGNAQLRAAWATSVPTVVDPTSGAARIPSVAQVAARRKLLAQLPPTPPTVTALAGAPGWTDGLEWFATAADICRAQAGLQILAATPAGAPLGQILSRNPGVDVGKTWRYVAFKGGSDSGVLAGSWFLQAPDGSRQVLVVQLSSTDPNKIPDDEWFASALGQAIRSLV